MAIKVRIPTPLMKLTDNQSEVSAEGETISDIINNLENQFNGIKDRICEENGAPRRFINIYINEEDIRFLEGEKTTVKDGDEISIIPAIAGGAWSLMIEFTDEQIERYSRHIILPEVGGSGQQKMLEARVLLLGAGGLGSPAAYYLAAAGIGNLGIVDFDQVDLSNLQRQIIHSTERIGMLKTESAKKTIQALNPDVNVTLYNEKMDSRNIMSLIKDYDYVVDGSDNFPTRYLVNDACVMKNKTLIHGSIYRFEGQVTVFKPGDGPCYRCLYPEPPPPGMVPNCQEGGVLGVLAGVIGNLQVVEVLKLILGIGKPLVGKLLIYDALNTEFRSLRLRRDANCPICGEKPTIKELVDYEEFCGLQR